MNKKKQLKTLLEEASVYISHGLFEEAKKSYQLIKKILEKKESLPNRDKLLSNMNKKLKALDIKINTIIDKKHAVTNIDSNARDIIKNKLFAFSGNNNSQDPMQSALEGGMNLARFGNYQDALDEFLEIFKFDILRLESAKHILRCLVAMDQSSKAEEIFKDWKAQEYFDEEEIGEIFSFLKKIPDKNNSIKKLLNSLDKINKPVFMETTESDGKFDFSDDLEFSDISFGDDASKENTTIKEKKKKKNITLDIDDFSIDDNDEIDDSLISLESISMEVDEDSAVSDSSGNNDTLLIDFVKTTGSPDALIPDEDIIEINSIEINIISGVREGEAESFNVINQSDNSISIIIPKKEKELLNCIEVGNRINEIMCYSPIAIFSGYGIVTSKIMIKAGQNKGDYGVNIKLKVE